MANYLIMRQQKLKSGGAVKGLAKHNFRAIPTANADLSRRDLNEHTTSSDVSEVMERYNELLPEKVRKNAIHAINYMITTSPEASEHNNELALQEGINWVTQKYGAENVIMSSIHRDEATPHLHIMVMPLKAGKLNAKHYVGGSKHRLSEMQTEFYEHVKGAGGTLERGIEGSEAKHESTAKWSAKQKELGKDVKLPSEGALLDKVGLTRRDLLSPEKANKRVSEVLEEVLGHREDALMSVEAHKVEVNRNKGELLGLRQGMNRAEQKIESRDAVIAERDEVYTDPVARDRMIEFLTELKRKYDYGRSKIDEIRDGIKDILSRTLYPSRDSRIDWSGRCEREAGREWCPSDHLRTDVATTPTERVQDRHNDLPGHEPDYSPSH